LFEKEVSKTKLSTQKKSFFFLRQNDEKNDEDHFVALFCFVTSKKLFLCFHQTKILLIVKITALNEWGQNIFSSLLFMGGGVRLLTKPLK
jgi:hypothetical protein